MVKFAREQCSMMLSPPGNLEIALHNLAFPGSAGIVSGWPVECVFMLRSYGSDWEKVSSSLPISI